MYKPGKDASIPKSYRTISLLCHTYKLYERLILNRITPTVESHIIKEQTGFRPGKACTSQLLNLTQHIEDGYLNRMTTGAAFAALSAAYDTVVVYPLPWPLLVGESDVPACGSPASFSVHLASSAVTPAGSVHKSRGDNVVRMWVQLKR